MGSALDLFSPATRGWFEGAFTAPTAVQDGAWRAISGGGHALVVAPTGSGKTLAAFLWAIDRLAAEASADRAPGTRVLYISPLKALGVDVERNLRSPLVGITRTATMLGMPEPAVSVGVRSGDTLPAERRALQKSPPEILITTPESLYLMLTSSARETLRTVDTVIVDEIHAVAATKRGAHLAVSLERLDSQLEKPAQRIGLSATVRPREEIARFLAGSAPVSIIAPEAAKRFDLAVSVPVDDMTELGSAPVREGATASAAPQASIWPHVEEEIVDRILECRSTIVFANSRRLAERLTARLNEIYEERLWGDAETSFAGSVGAGVAPSLRAGRSSSAPAQMMGASGQTGGSQGLLAMAHHGSVSKERRAMIEDELKSGRLRCVVATSSLELGIDMGAVDLVIQVEAPPSVASGLQRIGRAGHGVGEVSRGILFPKHRADLLHSAVATERMTQGLIEQIAVPQNPLDILAQQTVAAVALEQLDVEEWFDTVRRSAPFASLPRSAYDATLDLLSGRYPSDEFAELRPRIVWDRVKGTITGRPGAQRLAVMSGGTIPDRGLFGVFMVGDEGGGRRVGELDEEMVYESRVGDVFALGATSWRIEDITHDRVVVSPAFGQPGRVPFWKGDGLGRPAELGRAIGEFTRQLSAGREEAMRERLAEVGLDERAVNNLIAFVREQKETTGHVPTDRTLVVERFRDELGDWRLVLHSPFGMPVHAPWALAVSARIRDTLGIDGGAMAADDGIVVRIPDTDAPPPGADLFAFDPHELGDIVTREVGGSALFASRFRECAARALLLPRYNPARRSPLWQQRQRAAQLLSVAAKYPTFPIVLETVREVLQDVYDLPALTELVSEVEARSIRIVEVETNSASPFARSLLFGYVGAFMYEGDAPLAERRAAALSLDSALLGELLGRAELRELLDADVIEQTERELQRLAPERQAKDLEGAVDLLRMLGPMTLDELQERTASPVQEVELRELERSNRLLAVSMAGSTRWAVVEDAARLRDALGTPLPVGIPEAFLESVEDPVGDLVSRYARTHAPFTVVECAARLGLGTAVVSEALRRLELQRRVVEGEFRPGSSGAEWCDAEVLRRLRSRSLAALRQEVEPVDGPTLARFLTSWQHIDAPLKGVDGVAQVIEQLAGVPIPASALETLVLPARVRDYSPAMLDELTATGEVAWTGVGSLGSSDGWVALHLAETMPFTVAEAGTHDESELHTGILDALAGGGAYFFRQLTDAVGTALGSAVADDKAMSTALWDLVWAGLVTNDTLAPLRSYAGGPARRPSPRTRSFRGRARLTMPSQSGGPNVSGRWSLVRRAGGDDTTVRGVAVAEALLERHGIVTRGAVMSEGIRGGFSLAYKVLSRFEESGRARRGYFVEGLGAAQFATGPTIDRLRSFAVDPDAAPRLQAVPLAATDPANPYGAALPWPAHEGSHRPGRKAGALVVLVDGALVLYVEKGGKSTLLFDDEPAVVDAAAAGLVAAVRASGRRTRVERVNGEFVVGTPLGDALTTAGFGVTPQGLSLRA
ncbi:ATP-dependent helicase [Salinibacterium sp. dk2585]|uniref:ATP-dependent helicase n=1 Tax=unclassified Salinibacterium TaxID=2632331 RepID=UPI0011C25837|nr:MULTISPECIES: ATP-dependent helicase [unclassified Salinibacterium]QEE60586.1 ATP-dependent helicase [Salinibacterium sp. dk2585]TXK55658.1 ATP-dependent helicase [Salinibacterium sp. dk5596]